MHMTDIIHDVAVIGGGNAALCAAITAREAGCSVIIIEHAPKSMRGGNSRHTRNLRAMHDGPTSVLTESYLEDEYWDDLLRVTGGQTDEALARMTIRESSRVIPWMSKHGVRFQPSLTGTLNLSRTNAFFLGGGKALVNAYYLAAERLGITICYDSEVIALDVDDGFVKSATVHCAGRESVIRARCFVASSGGFQANLGMLRDAWGEAADNFLIRGTPYAQGTVLNLLLGQGVASIGDPSQFHAVAIDARSPKFDGGIVTRLDCIPFSIVVNRNAERFHDEGEDVWPKRYAIWGRLVAQQPGQIAWSVFDAKSRSLFMPSVYPAYQSDTIEGLASEIGLDPQALRRTVDDYNAAVRDGNFNTQILDDCATVGLTPPKTHWARRLDTPPYYSYPHRPGITFTYLGVKVDAQARVIMQDGKPTANLFASGEIMAGSILGKGYLAGFGMTIGTVFGRLAGEGAARLARN